MIRTRNRTRTRTRNRPLKYPEYDYEYEYRPARAGLSTISSLEEVDCRWQRKKFKIKTPLHPLISAWAFNDFHSGL